MQGCSDRHKDQCDVIQVLKGRLSVHRPTVMCNNFVYKEGEDLNEDEAQANAANLPKTLQVLPGALNWYLMLICHNVLLIQ